MRALQIDGCVNPQRSDASEFRRGVVACAPVLVGILPFALVLGAQAAQKGLSPIEMALMAGLNYAGGSEFAAIRLWSAVPDILLIVSVTAMVNSRHILMSAALAPFLKRLPRWKALAALFLMCDETWAMSLADTRNRAARGVPAAFSLLYYAGASLPIFFVWVAFTTLGAGIGPVLGPVESYGFDMAFPAVFLVLLRGMWRGVRAAQPWLVSLVVAGAIGLVAPGAWCIPAGALSGLLCAYLMSAKS
ncbi:AzlC family ABC transporter permease [Methylobacterium sp. 77]|uniref:AzlC family ABC transporter permease n=1 Tax=Methylobacterium sp. 77 TaxID=1101192 RepID=UPI00037340D0|nr:AzlC family ABC transporter permease [Methylobacterium sp. 77]